MAPPVLSPIGSGGKKGLGRSAKRERIEGLGNPRVRVRGRCEKLVRLSIEQEEDWFVRKTAGAGFLFDEKRRRHATHVPDLKVENKQLWFDLTYGFLHQGSLTHTVDVVRATECRGNIVEQPIGISGEQYCSH